MNIVTRQARFADALQLAARLRFEDAREIASAWGVGAREGLILCLLHSDRSFALWEPGRVLALWGVSTIRHAGLDVGLPWLLAGDELFRRRHWLVRRSRNWVDDLLLDYDALTNLTDAENTVHLRWLEWCGFETLARVAGHGLDGRTFVTFCRVNARRHREAQGVRELLRGLDRSPRAADADTPSRRLAGAAARWLSDPGSAIEEASKVCALIREIDALPASGGARRLRPGAVRLLAEIALGAAGRGRGRRADPGAPPEALLLREWFETLAGTADVLPAEPRLDISAAALDPAPVQWAAPASAPDRGARAALDRLVHGYASALTLRDRVSFAHGHRIRASAIGLSAADIARPLGMARREVEQLVEAAALAFALRSSSAATLADLHRQLYGQPLSHADAMVRLLGGAERPRGLGMALQRALEGRVVAGTPPAARGISSVGDALAVAAAVADEVAALHLPVLRLGCVIGGYPERYALACLLKTLLVAALLGRERAARLTQDEVAARLAAHRLESRLLARASVSEAVDGLMRDAQELRGADLATPADVGTLVTWLLPALHRPVVHDAQLPWSLLVWRLLVANRLNAAVTAMEEVFDAAAADSRPHFRKILIRLGAMVASVGRH